MRWTSKQTCPVDYIWSASIVIDDISLIMLKSIWPLCNKSIENINTVFETTKYKRPTDRPTDQPYVQHTYMHYDFFSVTLSTCVHSIEHGDVACAFSHKVSQCAVSMVLLLLLLLLLLLCRYLVSTTRAKVDAQEFQANSTNAIKQC